MIISIRILSYLGIIFKASDQSVGVKGSCSNDTAVSVSKNSFLFVKDKYSRIVFKWLIRD